MKINGHDRFIEDKKKSNVFDNNWEPKVSVSVTVSVDPCDMLKNFCFHVYAQKSLFIGLYVELVQNHVKSNPSR